MLAPEPTIPPRLFFQVFVLLAGLAAGCSATPDEDRASAAQALTDLPRVCARNEADVEDIIDEVVRTFCEDDAACPCGTRCGLNNFCTADCVSDTNPVDHCSPGLTCDNWGQCVPPGPPPPPPTALPVLGLDTRAVTLGVPAAGAAWATTAVVVTLTSTDLELGSHPDKHPKIHVDGASGLAPGCSDTNVATPCPVVAPSELEVACSTGAPFAPSCDLAGSWSFSAPVNGVVKASRTIYVRPVQGATAAAWDLRLSGDQAAQTPAHVTIERAPVVAPELAGRYAGQMRLTSTGPGATISTLVPARALASGESILLLDDTHLVSPLGKLRFTRGGAAQRSAWLVSGSTVEVVAEVALQDLQQDRVSGELTGSFTVRLPGWAGVAAGVQTWQFSFHREGPLPGASCVVDSSCAAGSTCDSVLQRCVPGPRWEPLADSAAADKIDVPALNVDGASVAGSKLLGTRDGTVDAAARLLCYDDTAPVPTFSHVAKLDGLEPSGKVLAHSGDLACTNGNTPFALRLPLLRDLDSAGRTVSQLFTTCLANLAAPASDFSRNDCVSLARTLPALALLAESPRRNDHRAGLLLQHILDGWLEVHAMLAREGRETFELNRAVTDQPHPTPVDAAALLDQIGAGWNVLLDATMSSTLTSLPPGSLRAPDYRRADRPVAYWAAGDQDVEPGHLNLQPRSGAGAGSSAIDLAADGPLSRDLTFTFVTAIDLFRGARTSTAVDSPWLRLVFDLPSGQFYERGMMRSGAHTVGPSTATWGECMAWAVTQHAVAWSWGSYRCWAYTSLGNRVLPDPSFGLFVRTGYLQASPDNDSYPSTVDVAVTRAGAYAFVPSATTWSACVQACNGPCTAWSFDLNTKKCSLAATIGNELPPQVPNNHMFSGLSPLGNRIASKTSFFEDGIQYSETPYSTTPHMGWMACHDKCVGDASCDGWSYDKLNQTCYLMANVEPRAANHTPYFMSARRGGIDLIGSHRVASGSTWSFRMHVSDQPYFESSSVTVVRKMDLGRYDVSLVPTEPGVPADPLPPFSPSLPSVAQGPGGTFRFTDPPYSPGPAALAIGRSGSFAALSDVAIFDTALDFLAIRAIDARRGDVGRPVTRGTLDPLDGADHEQSVGLPVKMLSTIEAEQALLATYIDSKQGVAATECAAHGATPQRDALLARAGEVLRRDALALSLADTLHERATRVRCNSDSVCAPLGGRCEAHYSLTIDALSMSRHGATTCSAGPWSDAVGICGTTRVDSPVDIHATADASFSVPAEGTYGLWARLVARELGADAFYVRIDGGAWTLWQVPTDPAMGENAWSWRIADGPLLHLALAAGQHTITIGMARPGAILRGLQLTNDLGNPSPTVRDNVCVDAQGAPIVQATSWDEAFGKARAAAAGATASLFDTVGRLQECRNPLGIEAEDLPLYFKDLSGSSARFFASSDFLMGLAQPSVDRAIMLFATAHDAWLRQKEAQFQRDLSLTEAQNRAIQIASTFETPLSELCGTPAMAPGDLLGLLAGGHAASCFVSPTTTCEANVAQPVSQADPACYHGQLGSALLAMKDASLKVAQAAQVWSSKYGEYVRQSFICVFKQGTQDIIKAHFEHLETLLIEKGIFDRIGLASDTAAAMTIGFATGNPDALFKIISVPGSATQLEIDDENAAFADEMARRNAAEDVLSCWTRADGLRDDIETQRIELVRAAAELDSARHALGEGLRHADQLVAQGTLALGRETGRTTIHPEFDYWVDKDVVAFQHEMAWAKRLTYLTLLAVEYDFQTTLDVRKKILDAQDPDDLNDALRALHGVQNAYVINGSRPEPMFIVLSLAQDILHLTGTKAEQAIKLRAILRDHAQRITSPTGKLLGVGIKFAITPESVHFLGNRCGERVWSSTAQVAMDPVQPQYRMPLRLLASNTFSSQWCAGQHDTPMQTSSTRPTLNLFLPSTAVPFVPAPPQTASDVLAPLATSPGPFWADPPPDGSVTDLAGHGLYSTYVLLFDPTDPAVDLTRIEDVYLRFDFLSGAAQ
jgi:hypothetical protein